MRVAVIGSPVNESTVGIVSAWRALGIDASLVAGAEVRSDIGPEDIALVRLDVLPTLDGIEPGLLQVLLLERRGTRVLNTAAALLAAHDKLRTARLLKRARIPHPATVHIRSLADLSLQPPVVLKPRFGSWGTDVVLCPDARAVRRRLREIEDRPWFRRHGAIAQEAVANRGRDLRVIVADGCVVGAAERVAAPGEWRTNISCGGSLHPAHPPDPALELAQTAAIALGADLVGVDLMPLGDDRYTVLELNGAVEFDAAYSFAGESVHEATAIALHLLPARSARHARAAPRQESIR
jgi:[lysine-biosynthesis-protein LysW]--L-2-aminoadipate ligase